MKTLVNVLCLTFSIIGFAQQTKQDQRVWFAYTGQFKTSSHWGYHLEAQFRMDNELEQNQQNLFRAGAVYFLSDAKTLTGGYALVNTFNTAANDFFKEHRLWQQYQTNHRWNDDRNTLTHRLRLEQRWVEQLEVTEGMAVSSSTAYQTRLRYLNRNLFPVLQWNATSQLYLLLQNEVFFNLGDNQINGKLLDQNRLLLGVGLLANANTRLELGYLNHYLTSSTSVDAMNHTVSVSLIQNLVLQKP